MHTRASARGSGKPMTVRVAMWSARHRWPVAVAWFVFTFGIFALSLVMGGTRTLSQMDDGVPRTESAIADQLFAAGGQGTPHEDLYLVARASGGVTAQDPAFRAAVDDMRTRLSGALDATGQPLVAGVLDPFAAPPEAGLISQDGSSVRLVGAIEGKGEAVTAKTDALRPVIDQIEAAHPEFEVHALNNTLINQDLERLVSSDLDGSLRLTLPATFLILLLAFGAAVAAAVPLVLALTALLAGFGLLGIYSQLVAPVALSTSQLVVLIGLAVGVDYSLFMLTRFRSERRAGRSKLVSIEVASGTAGRAVFFSGLAVAASLAGLFLLRVDMLNSMAIAMIGVVLVAVIGSLTFLPAVMAILGDNVNRLGIPFLRREGVEGTGVWARIVRVVVRRPAMLGAVAVIALMTLATPVGHLRLGSSDIASLPQGVDGVAAWNMLNKEWPQGTTLRLNVVVTGAQQPATQAAIERLKTEGLRDGGVGGPVTVLPSGDGSVAAVVFVMPGDQNDTANQATVERFRSSVVPSIFGGLPGTAAYVSGGAAMTLDYTRIFTDGTPLVFGFVLTLSFLLLLVAFRSIVIPATAILLNLLSAGAAYGVLTLVFQDGWLAQQLGIVPYKVIQSFVPLFIFTIVYGLSMDYHFFILTRIKEARDRGLDSRAAVEKGISLTAGTVTSAAAIMVVVFAVFVTMKMSMIQQLGLGLAVAVFIDATLIRSVVLPAAMTLLGDWNWYLPSFLRWLPHVRIEADDDDDDPDAEPPAGLVREPRFVGGLGDARLAAVPVATRRGEP